MLVVCLVAGACGGSPKPGVRDVQEYLARADHWAGAEAEASRTIGRILATHFVDEAEVRRQIADSGPRVRAHLERIQAYTPTSPRLGGIHERYVAAWQGLIRGYQAIERGFDTGDYAQLADGRRAMEHWRATILGVADDLGALKAAVGLDADDAVES